MEAKLVASDNGHFYQVGEEYYPSSTTILRKSFPMETGLKMFLQNKTKEEADSLLIEAGLSGSKVHHAIELILQGIEIKSTGFTKDDIGNCGLSDPKLAKYLTKPFNKKEDTCLRGFINWCEKFKPEVIKTELIVYSKNYKYAGTLDFIGNITIKNKKTPVIIDWKTSKGLYREFDLQVSSYWRLLKDYEIYTPYLVQFGVNKCGFRMKEIKEPDNNFNQFINLKKTFDYLYPNYQPTNYEFLDSYKI